MAGAATENPVGEVIQSQPIARPAVRARRAGRRHIPGGSDADAVGGYRCAAAGVRALRRHRRGRRAAAAMQQQIVGAIRFDGPIPTARLCQLLYGSERHKSFHVAMSKMRRRGLNRC
ncbi:hypothetical protein I553_10571 [Mycobacterium xenopi 4042]|uniref:Uncharacterized protein n=1 Tax=Mycobacterium xenopi 4042 TaxID=1299334 RepID=X7ZFJ9_MYCXE|nr:hypothetical protein I553_10571 [Mycobacterium xenopi 4042]